MSNADEPASPLRDKVQSVDGGTHSFYWEGLTKLEYTCIHTLTPGTDDPELNAIIAEARRMELAKAAMQGLCAALPTIADIKDLIEDGVSMERFVAVFVASMALATSEAVLCALGEDDDKRRTTKALGVCCGV